MGADIFGRSVRELDGGRATPWLSISQVGEYSNKKSPIPQQRETELVKTVKQFAPRDFLRSKSLGTHHTISVEIIQGLWLGRTWRIDGEIRNSGIGRVDITLDNR